MNKPKSISLSVDMNTDKMQLKLRAIAKHFGTLADELDKIDNYKECPKCGSLMNTSRMYLDNELKSITSECDCGFVMVHGIGTELPTHLESSE